MSSIGIMDEGYFVSRSEIFDWIKSALNIETHSLQQLGKGDIYCQLLDHFHPGCIQMSQITKSPRMNHDVILNLKHLQNGIDKLGIERRIDIAKISKCKPLQNLEFSQWLKRILQKEGERISLTYMNTSVCRVSAGSTAAHRIQRNKENQYRFNTNSSHGNRKYRQSINISGHKPDPPVKQPTPPLKQKPVLVPAQRMRFIEAILSDSSTADEEKLQYIRSLVLPKGPSQFENQPLTSVENE